VESARRDQRHAAARQALERAGAAWLLVPPSADFRWLTGAQARSTERLVAFALPREGSPFAIVPRLEADALAAECPWLERLVWEDGEDPLARLLDRLKLEPGARLLLGEGFRTSHVLTLAAKAECRPAADALSALRVVKDAEELRLCAEAGRHADQVVEEAADRMRPRMSERELARFILERFEALGDHDPWAIVASGSNSALPHHMSGDRKLQDGEVVLLDLGAFTGGYGSDITRTFWLGHPPEDAERVYHIVDDARRAGIAAARPGAPAESVDRAARAVIEAAGFGPQFLHRTGHGVGLEVHEPPYLVHGNRAPLQAGMVHSVEPGIYLPGRFGVRLEDLVVVGSEGAQVLNRAPLDPLPLKVR